jgi:hypothetical protein
LPSLRSSVSIKPGVERSETPGLHRIKKNINRYFWESKQRGSFETRQSYNFLCGGHKIFAGIGFWATVHFGRGGSINCASAEMVIFSGAPRSLLNSQNSNV